MATDHGDGEAEAGGVGEELGDVVAAGDDVVEVQKVGGGGGGLLTSILVANAIGSVFGGGRSSSSGWGGGGGSGWGGGGFWNHVTGSVFFTFSYSHQSGLDNAGPVPGAGYAVTRDGGQTWEGRNKGLTANFLPKGYAVAALSVRGTAGSGCPPQRSQTTSASETLSQLFPGCTTAHGWR